MKIALINPNINGEYPQPPLGLLSVAASCIANGHDVRLLDANAHKLSAEKVLKEIECQDVVGITATSLSFSHALELAKQIKQEQPGHLLVLGGIHATLFPDEIINTGVFDMVIQGEGENLMPAALWRMVSGVYGGGKPVDQNALPPLPYDLLDGFRPRIAYGKHQPFMPILTARGCPFKCSFCSNAVFGNSYRAKSVKKVMREIYNLITDYGIREIKIYDDVFTLDKYRAIELSQRIGGNVAWSCMTRVNLVDQNVLGEMKRGGCYAVAYGLESGDPDILKSICKNTTLEQAEQAVRYSREVGMTNIVGYFMLGAPGETLETIEKTIRFAISLPLHHAQFSIATALPGSELYYSVPREKRANSYSLNDKDNPSLCGLSPAQLKWAQAEAYKRFKRGK